MRILVTGATGFVASHLIPALADSGHEVIALGHDADRMGFDDSVERMVVDLAAPPNQALPLVDAIVHLAQANVRFPAGADALFAVNTAATVRLLEHARLTGASRFVLASSGSVYGTSNEPLAEASPLDATDFYAATKIAAERLVGAYASELSTWILRIFVPYGPHQTGRMIPAIAGRIRGGQPILLNGGGRPRMNPVYIDDLVDTIIFSLRAGEQSEIVNVAGEDIIDIRGLALALGTVLGVEPVFDEGNVHASGDIVAATDHLTSIFPSLRRTSLPEGLQRTFGSSED